MPTPDRVAETTTAVGTGNLALSGTAADRMQTFAGAGYGDGALPFAVSIDHDTAEPREWEVCRAELSSGVIVRGTLLESSTGSRIDFSAGTKVISIVPVAVDVETPAGATAKVAAHANLTNNPHAVTAGQVGADATGTAASAVSAHNSAADAHGVRLPPTPVGQANGRILTVASDALVYANAAGGGGFAPVMDLPEHFYTVGDDWQALATGNLDGTAMRGGGTWVQVDDGITAVVYRTVADFSGSSVNVLERSGNSTLMFAAHAPTLPAASSRTAAASVITEQTVTLGRDLGTGILVAGIDVANCVYVTSSVTTIQLIKIVAGVSTTFASFNNNTVSSAWRGTGNLRVKAQLQSSGRLFVYVFWDNTNVPATEMNDTTFGGTLYTAGVAGTLYYGLTGAGSAIANYHNYAFRGGRT